MWGWLTYLDQPILEAHSFRQTQTALTSYWMIREGFRLAYSTPVAGYPWPIPFEFPLYQWVVAVIAQVARTPLTDTGRSVSFVFFVVSLIPAATITKRLGLSHRVWFAFAALFLSSPLYLFWGRTFMIETLATCLMLLALAYGIDVALGTASWRTVVAAFLWTTLALLQKVSTVLPVVVLLGAWALVARRAGPEPRRRLTWSEWLKPLAAWVPALALGALWNGYSDMIRAQNPVGVFASSLHPVNVLLWNFGWPGQRVSSSLWVEVVLLRGIFQNAGAGLGAILIVAALVWRPERRTRGIVAATLAAYFATLLIFSNLHIVHEYYQVACTVFLVGAIAVAIGEWLPRAVPGRFVWAVSLALVVAANIYQFSIYELPFMQLVISPRTHRTLAIAEELDRVAPRDAPILVYGFEWSSEVAYYARRKSFTVPDFVPDVARTLTEPEAFLGGATPGAVVACPGGRATPEMVDRLLAARTQYSEIESHGCRILFRHVSERGHGGRGELAGVRA